MTQPGRTARRRGLKYAVMVVPGDVNNTPGAGRLNLVRFLRTEDRAAWIAQDPKRRFAIYQIKYCGVDGELYNVTGKELL